MREDGPIFTLENVVIFDVNMKVGHRPKNICITFRQLSSLRFSDVKYVKRVVRPQWWQMESSAQRSYNKETTAVVDDLDFISENFPSLSITKQQHCSSPRAPIILVFFIFPIMRQVCQCYPSTNLWRIVILPTKEIVFPSLRLRETTEEFTKKAYAQHPNGMVRIERLRQKAINGYFYENRLIHGYLRPVWTCSDPKQVSGKLPQCKARATIRFSIAYLL